MVASNLFLVFSGLLLIEYCTDNPQDIVVQSHTIYDIFLKNWSFPWNKPNSYWGFFMTKETLRGFFFNLSSTSPGWWVGFLFYFSIGKSTPNWLNPIFQRGRRCTTNWNITLRSCSLWGPRAARTLQWLGEGWTHMEPPVSSNMAGSHGP